MASDHNLISQESCYAEERKCGAEQERERIVARINATRRYNGSLDLPEARENNRSHNQAIDDCLAAIRSEGER